MMRKLSEFYMAISLFNPFPGLRPFESREAHLFFGRDGQSDELLRRLRRTRFLAVVGTSGSGKSSLMQAGLLPALHGGMMAKAGAFWRVAIMRPGADPLGNLAQALHATQLFPVDAALSNYQASILRAGLSRSSLGLIETCKQATLPANENLLVVVDQFEELFRFKQEAQKTGHGDEAAAFVQLLLEAGKQTETPIYVVLTMRSDFLGDCAQFQNLPEAMNDGQYLIPRMTREQRRAAITGPIAVAQGEITPRLVNRLLNDVGDNPDQLPILQHALMRSWDFWQAQRRNGERPTERPRDVISRGSAPIEKKEDFFYQTDKDEIDLPHYDAIGGMARALSKHADEVYNELPDERSRKIAEIMFKRLTEKGADNREVRRSTSLQELADVTEASVEEVITAIEHFRQPGRSFLMPPANEKLTSTSIIDISHESLIRNWERLKIWVDEEVKAARTYKRIAESADLYKKKKAAPWRDPDLKIALEWQQNFHPNWTWAQRYNPNYDNAIHFLNESKDCQDTEIKEKARQSKKEHKYVLPSNFIILLTSLNGIFLLLGLLLVIADVWTKNVYFSAVAVLFISNITYFSILLFQTMQLKKITKYSDFEITIYQPRGNIYSVSVISSLLGETDPISKAIDFSEIWSSLLKWRQNKRQGDADSEKKILQFGTQLSSIIFSTEIQELYEMVLDQAIKKNEGIRVKLRLDTPELSALPWELLYNKRLPEGFWALNSKTSIVRHIPLMASANTKPFRTPLKILVIIASPVGLPPLDVEREISSIKNALRRQILFRSIKLITIRNATILKIDQYLRYNNIDIIHFIGHSDFDENRQAGFILLEDETRSTHLVDAEYFSQILHHYATIKLVVLNSGQSASSAAHDQFTGFAHMLVRSGIPAVIGMQFEITDETAIQFTGTFYKILIDTFSIDSAINEARRAIMIRSGIYSEQWAAPVLFMGSSAKGIWS